MVLHNFQAHQVFLQLILAKCAQRAAKVLPKFDKSVTQVGAQSAQRPWVHSGPTLVTLWSHFGHTFVTLWAHFVHSFRK